MSATDTPDFQQGVVTSQVLLATSGAGAGEMPNIGLPTNCETLVVMIGQPPGGVGSVRVVGVTSGLQYPGVQVPANVTSPTTNTWLFDVSTVIDTQVNIFFANNTTGKVYVYADSGVHLAVDPAQAGSDLGQSYVVPTVPSTSAGNHPPVEITPFGGNVGAPAVVVASPGAGKRIRLFYAGMINDGGSGAGQLVDSITGVAFCLNSTTQAGYMPFVPQGVPLSQNASLNFANLFAANSSVVWGGYTVESVF